MTIWPNPFPPHDGTLDDLSMGANPEGRGGNTSPPAFLPEGGTIMLLSPQLLRDSKSIFCHQVHFIYFLYRLKSVITNVGEHGEDASPQYFLLGGGGDTNTLPNFTQGWTHLKTLMIWNKKLEHHVD